MLELMDDSMLISENYERGNKAMASVLLLYYHLASKGKFVGSETIYVDSELFNGFDYLDVSVSPQNECDINEKLLREGAAIYLICELNDMVTEHEENFFSFEYTKKLLGALASKGIHSIPELGSLLAFFTVPESNFDFSSYFDSLDTIYAKYVQQTFIRLGNVNGC